MDRIDKLISDLNCTLPSEISRYAIRELAKQCNKDIMLRLIHPKEKTHWENAAKALKEIGYPNFKPVIPEMIEWLRDINWPGSMTIIECLNEIDLEVLMPYLLAGLTQAKLENDDLWIGGIKILAGKQDDMTKKLMPIEYREILNNCGWC